MLPRTILLLLAALGSTACGASYQRIYEGDVRFEHCYRLDADPSIDSQVRLACWSEWTFAHTLGQTYDRVLYARRREAALRSGETAAVGPTLVTGQTSSVASQQQALSSRPRPSATSSSALALNAPEPAPSTLSSRQLCSQECGQTFTACVTRCTDDGCAQKCGVQVKACLESCL